MKCSRAKILLSAMLDGEISPREELALRRHISSCPICKEERKELHTLRAFLSIWTEEEPAPSLKRGRPRPAV